MADKEGAGSRLAIIGAILCALFLLALLGMGIALSLKLD